MVKISGGVKKMAVWQVNFLIVPESVIDGNSEDHWIGHSVIEESIQEISKCLEEGTSWSKDIRIFGKGDETCLELIYNEGILCEILVRIDLRELKKEVLESLLCFAERNHARLITESRDIIEQKMDIVIAEMKKSNAYRFVTDPYGFLDNLEKENQEISKKRAEELFNHYNGSFFFMDREGEYEEFLTYEISEDELYRWAIKLQKEHKEKMSCTIGRERLYKFDSFLEISPNYKISIPIEEILELYIRYFENTGAFTRLLVNEALLRYNEKNCNRDLTKFIKQNMELLKAEVEECIREYLSNWDSMEDGMTERKMFHRIQENLEKLGSKSIWSRLFS